MVSFHAPLIFCIYCRCANQTLLSLSDITAECRIVNSIGKRKQSQWWLAFSVTTIIVDQVVITLFVLELLPDPLGQSPVWAGGNSKTVEVITTRSNLFRGQSSATGDKVNWCSDFTKTSLIGVRSNNSKIMEVASPMTPTFCKYGAGFASKHFPAKNPGPDVPFIPAIYYLSFYLAFCNLTPVSWYVMSMKVCLLRHFKQLYAEYQKMYF